MIFCHKLQKEAPGLEYMPFPGAMGQRIYDTISASAWESWLQHQTMLINEYRLNLLEPKSREFLEQEMLKFLFEGGHKVPEGYTPTK